MNVTEITSEIKKIASSVEFNDCAHCIHTALMEQLAKAGFGCVREVDAFYQGRTGIRKGRIDIVAYRDGQQIGIEVDNGSPRGKSIKKLLGMKLDYRFMILRRRLRDIPHIPGIDGIFYINPPRGFGGILNARATTLTVQKAR